MAKKGQKFQKYDLNFINEVLKFKKNHSTSETSKEFNIPKGTILTWTYKQNHRDGELIRKKGRSRETEASYKERYEILKKLHDFYKSQIDKK